MLNPPASKRFLRDQYCTSVAKANYYWHPMDLLIQSGILSAKHDVRVLDAISMNITKEKCTRLICDIKPEYILFTTGFLSKEEDLEYVGYVARRIECTIIATGGYLLYEAENVMRQNFFVDAVLNNYTSDAILNYIDGNEELYDICVRKNGRIVVYPESRSNVISYPTPIYILFPLDKYISAYSSEKYMSILTSFGCPYQCNFCVARGIPYRETDFYDFDKFLFTTWRDKPNRKGKDEIPWGVEI